MQASPQMSLNQQQKKGTPAVPVSLKTHLESSVTKAGVFKNRKGDWCHCTQVWSSARSTPVLSCKSWELPHLERELKYINQW